MGETSSAEQRAKQKEGKSETKSTLLVWGAAWAARRLTPYTLPVSLVGGRMAPEQSSGAESPSGDAAVLGPAGPEDVAKLSRPLAGCGSPGCWGSALKPRWRSGARLPPAARGCGFLRVKCAVPDPVPEEDPGAQAVPGVPCHPGILRPEVKPPRPSPCSVTPGVRPGLLSHPLVFPPVQGQLFRGSSLLFRRVSSGSCFALE